MILIIENNKAIEMDVTYEQLKHAYDFYMKERARWKKKYTKQYVPTGKPRGRPRKVPAENSEKIECD
jgi:hypothetical protein